MLASVTVRPTAFGDSRIRIAYLAQLLGCDVDVADRPEVAPVRACLKHQRQQAPEFHRCRLCDKGQDNTFEAARLIENLGAAIAILQRNDSFHVPEEIRDKLVKMRGQLSVMQSRVRAEVSTAARASWSVR